MTLAKITTYPLGQNDQIPNNPKLPLLFYQKVFASSEDLKGQFVQAFKENHWGGSWTNGVYNYHHYHSTSHEVLGVYSGEATLIFGGPSGKLVAVSAGDMVIIPAGVGHCCKEASKDFKVIGAYPRGQEDYDLCTERDSPEEKQQNIERVVLPIADPVAGKQGPLMQEWR